MKTPRWTACAVIVLGALSLGSGCPTIPKLEDRTVELAVGGSTVLSFDADGSTNVWDETGLYDLANDIDINALLDDAGMSVDKVKDIKLSGISYRVSRAQTGRSIQNGTVTASRTGYMGGAAQTLVSSFNQDVSATTGWISAPVTNAGVDLVNGLLTDILTAAKNHTPVANSVVTYHVTGTSVPQGTATDFTWEIKLDVSIVGEVDVQVLD